MRHFGSDGAPASGAARVTRTSQCRWTARLRVGLALLDQESRWWRWRQLWSLLQNAAEVRWHRSFDNRACRTTLRETGHFTATDVHQPYFRRSPYEGLVFILSLLFTVDATHVSSLFVGREPQNRGSLVRRRRLDVPGLAQPHYLVVERSPDGSTGGVARHRRGAEHIAPCRIVGCCAPAPAYRGLPIRLRFRGRVTEVRNRHRRRTAVTCIAGSPMTDVTDVSPRFRRAHALPSRRVAVDHGGRADPGPRDQRLERGRRQVPPAVRCCSEPPACASFPKRLAAPNEP